MLLTNGRVIFNSIPEGFPEPCKTVVYDESEKINISTVVLDGGFLVKTLWLSVDPYMRGRMNINESGWPFTLGEPITGHGVGIVVKTESPEVKMGDHIYGFFKFQSYNIFKSLNAPQTINVLVPLENKENIPWSAYVGVLGMPGQTAYMGWKEHANAKKGETVFVSGGAGAVGSAVVQIAKAQGLKVISSAGSEDKVEFMRSIGADVAFNYKTADTAKILKEHGPIDIYWDNVGGETLDAALVAANVGARFLECGMISTYNSGYQDPIKNMFQVITKGINIRGFGVVSLIPKYEQEFYKEFYALVASGEVKHREHVYEGLESVGEALLAVQKGTNTGKAVVRVA